MSYSLSDIRLRVCVICVNTVPVPIQQKRPSKMSTVSTLMNMAKVTIVMMSMAEVTMVVTMTIMISHLFTTSLKL